MQATVRLALTLAVLLALPHVSLAQHRVQWVGTWPEATSLAQRSQRLVLLHFWNYNCPPCELLERRVFNQPVVIRAIHSRYVPLKVNVADNPKMAEDFKIEKWPTDVIVTPDGREVYRSVSKQDPNQFVATLYQIAAHASVGMPVNGSAFTPPPPAQSNGTNSLGPASSSFPIPGASGPTAPGRHAETLPAQPSPVAPPAMVNNQFVGGLQQNAPAKPAEMAPAYGGGFQVPAAPPTTSNDPGPPTSASRDSRPQGQVPGAADGPHDARLPNTVAKDVTAAHRSPATDPAGPPQPPAAAAQNNSPALDGFCPVTLVEHETWTPGNPRWGAWHSGRLYFFASAEQYEKFMANYDKYAPAMSGFDPVRYVEEGVIVEGKRAHGVFFEDQIVLFVDEDSLQRFWQAPKRYAVAFQGSNLNRR